MQINKKYKPWLVASSDETRPSILAAVYYDHEKHTLAATDGSMLIIVPVIEDENDSSGLIPAEALKAAYSCTHTKKWTNYVIQLIDSPEDKKKTALLMDGRTFPLIDRQFPELSAVIPDPEKWDGAQRVRLSFDAEKLYDLLNAARAMGKGRNTKVTLDFNAGDERGPLVVNLDGATTAILMKCRC